MLLAQSWVAASEGSLREALTLARQAAELAAAHHQLAAEVCALHTAVCFGDRTVADRLAELACQVDGPRACAAAAHAAALAVDDKPGLLGALIQLEEMGALPPAADAAAQAAIPAPRPRRSRCKPHSPAPAPPGWRISEKTPPLPHCSPARRRCRSAPANAKSRRWSPLGCPIDRSPPDGTSPSAPSKVTSTEPAPDWSDQPHRAGRPVQRAERGTVESRVSWRW